MISQDKAYRGRNWSWLDQNKLRQIFTWPRQICLDHGVTALNYPVIDTFLKIMVRSPQIFLRKLTDYTVFLLFGTLDMGLNTKPPSWTSPFIDVASNPPPWAIHKGSVLPLRQRIITLMFTKLMIFSLWVIQYMATKINYFDCSSVSIGFPPSRTGANWAPSGYDRWGWTPQTLDQ